jgi:hypothetical protein
MAIRVVAPDGEEWRSGMNNSPVFAVSPPQAFYDMTLAQDIDPTTGKPNPAAMQKLAATHPGRAIRGMGQNRGHRLCTRCREHAPHHQNRSTRDGVMS